MSIIDFWEDRSSTYDARDQGDMPEHITSLLHGQGFFDDCDDLLEIGSGPGTYSIPMSHHVKRIHCLDSSKGMLVRLMEAASHSGVSNIIYHHDDWMSFRPDKMFDVSISTFCPGTSSSESILHMESLTRHRCAIISWNVNHGDDALRESRRILSLDDPLSKRGMNKAASWLEDNGRSFEHIPVEYPISLNLNPVQLVSEIVRDLDVDDKEVASKAAWKAVSNNIVDGRYVLDDTNRIDIVLWEVPRRLY